MMVFHVTHIINPCVLERHFITDHFLPVYVHDKLDFKRQRVTKSHAYSCRVRYTS